jgi:hypothetical protein
MAPISRGPETTRTTQTTQTVRTTRTLSAPASTTAEKARTPMTRAEVRKMLRDAAFVLRVTARLKAEILAGRPETAKVCRAATPELPAGLGV